MRKNSKKNTRINGEVKKELSVLITREIKDPRINPLTSVLDVEVAPDLKTAKVYVSVMGDDESRKTTLQGLKSASPFMRSQLARNLNLRNTPELTFIMDNSIEYGINMSKLIDELNSKSSDSSDSTDSSEDDMDDENKYDDEYDDEEDDE